jgi:branched-chain amino acid transport system ATP-binding protein
MALVVKDLVMRFGGITAVENLSFEVEDNSVTSLIGPNGAGKTSVFNCITGFYKATSGDILFEDKSLINLKPFKITKRGIVRTFQNVRLFKSMTVFENVMSGFHSVTKQLVVGAFLRHPAERREEKEIFKSAEFYLDYVGMLSQKDACGEAETAAF